MGTAGQPPQRLAVAADADAIRALMDASIRALFPRFYDPAHTEAPRATSASSTWR